jgi:hypothetical protein
MKIMSLFLVIMGLPLQAFNDENRNCNAGSIIFYDFELADEDNHIEYWASSMSGNSYRNKKAENFGAMLISHGYVPVALGYGKMVIIQNGKNVIDKKCPACKKNMTN